MTTSTTPTPLSGPESSEWPVTTGHSAPNGPLNTDRGRLRAAATPQRLSLAALLALTAVLYTWGLGASGYANEFYSAAVQAGTQSWKAMFFGSFDSANAITVDKPPAALWPMEISGRIFGFNSWSMLVPQAIEGVLTVWLLYATIRRWFGHGAGLLAGALLALTPVAVLMFRFNNPDALMVLLIVLASYCTTRAIENGSTKWLLFAGGVMGFSFLAKGLQPFTVLPALALAFLICAPGGVVRRLVQLLGAGVAIVVGAGWWVLAVDLTPASSRPYIGGSGDNSALGLAFGYNGLDRLSTGSGGGPGGSFSGSTGFGRLFNDLNGAQISWLLPTALFAIVTTAIVSARAPRLDRTRAALIVWGGSLLVTGLVLSFAGGIIHTYYTVELAPAVAAVVAIGTTVLWRRRESVAARVGLAAGLLVSAFWSFELLGRTPDFAPWLRWVLVVAALAGAALLVLQRRALVVTAAVLGLVVAGGGPAAYALDTASTPHTGSTPTAGPATTSGGFGGRGGMPGAGRGGFGGTPPGGTGGTGGFPGGTAPGGVSGGATTGGAPTGSAPTGGAPTGSAPTGRPTGGGMGGGATTSAALSKLIENTDTTWAAATVGSQTAGALELATGKAVIAIGGFSGSDPAPTLAQFKTYVAAGKVRYFVSGGGMGGRGGAQSSGTAISTWVAANYTSTTVGGSTVYDLTKAKS